MERDADLNQHCSFILGSIIRLFIPHVGTEQLLDVRHWAVPVRKVVGVCPHWTQNAAQGTWLWLLCARGPSPGCAAAGLGGAVRGCQPHITSNTSNSVAVWKGLASYQSQSLPLRNRNNGIIICSSCNVSNIGIKARVNTLFHKKLRSYKKLIVLKILKYRTQF